LISLFKVHMPDSALESVKAVLYSGYIGQGPVVDEFERQLRPRVGRAPVTTMTGTAAIQLALRLAGVGPGTSVVSTPMTCSATNEPILALGADIIWADIDPVTGEIDPDDVRRKIRSDTRAVVCVDWGGYPCALDELRAIAHERGAKLIEDAAHAFGSIYRGAYVGSSADYVCFSFQAIKTITTIEGGAITCADDADLARAKLLRWYGIDREGARKDLRCEEDIVEYGYKANLNDVHAAIGLRQLAHVDALLHAARANAAFYEGRLGNLPHLRLVKHAKDRLSSFWLFTLHVENRDAFREHMAALGIMTSQVHARNDVHTVFRPFAAELPGVDAFSKTQIAIPVGWWITDADRERIAMAIEEWTA
jgi:dTDP-4-amino-4,6-dideoxygalactose transaminase